MFVKRLMLASASAIVLGVTLAATSGSGGTGGTATPRPHQDQRDGSHQVRRDGDVYAERRHGFPEVRVDDHPGRAT